MKLRRCERDAEVRALLRQGHWPEACTAELRAHAEGCRRCSEVVTLTLGFQQMRQTAVGSARLAPPGIIWWRAQLRQRQQALEQASQPLRWAVGFAVLVSLCAGAGLLGWASRTGGGARWVSSLAAFAGSIGSVASGLMIPCMTAVGVLALVGVWVLWDSRAN